MENEKRNIPIMFKLKNNLEGEIVFAESPRTNKAKPLYIWYFTPVSKLASLSTDSIDFKACAPKAPKIMDVQMKKIAKRMIFLFIIFQR